MRPIIAPRSEMVKLKTRNAGTQQTASIPKPAPIPLLCIPSTSTHHRQTKFTTHNVHRPRITSNPAAGTSSGESQKHPAGRWRLLLDRVGLGPSATLVFGHIPPWLHQADGR